MANYCQQEVYKCVSSWGMEAVLSHLIQRCRDENCDDAYLVRLIANLETTLFNYKDRNKEPDGES